ncbi:hypothetical protein FRG77_07940 [Listeria monocytogenes]|nr:hypothetical protein [Listeria monocytogenes]EAF5440048.1 hypothetical protein [Listeria monocytogenes]ECK4904236.1 hypothetical protein [Listeria monocytogenes]
MLLIFWSKDGQTAQFDLVGNVEVNKQTITFNYRAKSTGIKREAVFILNNIAGMAVENDGPENENKNGVFRFNIPKG